MLHAKIKTLEDAVILAQKEKNEAERLISDFKPFIASVIQKRTGKYLEYGTDDELSIGLIAFHEAIKSYDKNKGKFLSFARLVVTNRLIDYYRKQSRYKTVAFESDDDDEDISVSLLDRQSLLQYELDSEEEDRKFEIIEYTNALKKWGISFSDLVKVSPKQETLRNEYKKIASLIASDQKLLGELEKNKRLPIKELEKLLTLHRKKIERGRIYIIALVVAIINRFSFLELVDREQGEYK